MTSEPRRIHTCATRKRKLFPTFQKINSGQQRKQQQSRGQRENRGPKKHDKCSTSKICSDYLRDKKPRGLSNQICFENRITLIYNNIQNIRRKEIDSPKHTIVLGERDHSPTKYLYTHLQKKLETVKTTLSFHQF